MDADIECLLKQLVDFSASFSMTCEGDAEENAL